MALEEPREAGGVDLTVAGDFGHGKRFAEIQDLIA